MNIGKTILAAAVAATAFSAPALAQETEFQLPEQCTTAATAGGMDHSAMGHGNMAGNQGAGMMEMMGMGGMDLESMPEHVRENVRKMMISMPAMHEGMMMEDADVAFACGMIAHHQGAIDMAEVLLEHGDDPQMRALAEEIIAAQGPEIERMTAWLAENAN
ncbi:DUF305 domain-containing protein [Cereibacter johrii]|uniref:DUF305 domain-containing protein n=1 Tax=Cereibacter johrii TaxID=445629 RepID=A0ABX5J4C3_9RHOB|nr:DUF305 domain-containing protein [Cereibacter johrii]ODM44902.1 DUF305 domain-containing protein [Cereibacter johrii]PTM77188.1 hypothetical protein C8J29_106114 [Cereibacter johrii]